MAVTRDGERVPYDHLIVATGARMLWAVPGAVTFWGVADEGQVGDVIARPARRVACDASCFTMPAGHSWGLPLYELALLAVSELEKAGNGRTRITVVTPEDAPLEVFGRRAAGADGRAAARAAASRSSPVPTRSSSTAGRLRDRTGRGSRPTR